jgi:hypothetical protein
METTIGDLGGLSRLEFISLYINGYYELDAEARSRFEAEFRKRKLPLPSIPETAPAVARAASIDRKCFTSYVLLIYTGTAIFYSWIYLALRLVKMDFRDNTRHKLIQSAMALFYVIAEILAYDYFIGFE